MTASPLPEYVRQRATGVYRDLNPTTKLVVAFATAAVAFGVRGWTGPLAMLAVVAVTAVAGRVGRSMFPFVLATIPLVASILIVNALYYPGATDVIVDLGPVALTGTGLTAALQATLRVVAFALSVAVFSLTTSTEDLLSDLERRGHGRRGIFIVGSAIGTIPRMIERAAEITESQRARGLDTQGSPWRRIRGIVPLAGPMISSSLSEVEERSMALEARAFTAPTRRVVLRDPPDSPVQRLVRWVVVTGAVGVVVGSVSGIVRLP
jgi:energy-coupling factor transport system permease protein